MSDTIEWFKDARSITNLHTQVAKTRFAKRLKNAGVELLYGAGCYPISITYKDKLFNSNSRLAKLCKLIDRKTWDSVTSKT